MTDFRKPERSARTAYHQRLQVLKIMEMRFHYVFDALRCDDIATNPEKCGVSYEFRQTVVWRNMQR